MPWPGDAAPGDLHSVPGPLGQAPSWVVFADGFNSDTDLEW